MLDSVLYTLCALIPVVLLALAFRAKSRWRFIPLAAYLVSYLPMSLSGKYLVSNHGGADWASEWWPLYLGAQYHAPSGRAKAGFTHVGSAFWPLVFFDQFIWHRTHEPTETEFHKPLQ